MIKKYRVKLGDDRVIGPFFKEQITELYEKGHISGQEQCQLFPDGDWCSLYEIDELAEAIRESIAKKLQNLTEAEKETPANEILGESTILMELGHFEDKNKKAGDSSQKEDKTSAGHREFRIDINKIKQQRLEELDDGDDSPPTTKEKTEAATIRGEHGGDGNFEKTVVKANIKHALSKEEAQNLDRTVVVQRMEDVIHANIKAPTSPKSTTTRRFEEFQDDQNSESSSEEKEQTKSQVTASIESSAPKDFAPAIIVSSNEATQCIDLQEIKEDLKVQAETFEQEIINSEPPSDLPSTQDEASQENEEESGKESKTRIIINTLAKNKKKTAKAMSPIVAIAFAVILYDQLFDDSDKKDPFNVPITPPGISFPIAYEKTNKASAVNFYQKGIEAYNKGTYPDRVEAAKFFASSLEQQFDNNPALGNLLLTNAELLRNSTTPEKDGETLFKLIQIAKMKSLNDINVVMGMATFFAELKKYPAAIQTIENYLRLAKPSVKLSALYLDILTRAGDLAKAKPFAEQLSKLPKQSKTLDVYISLSQYLYLNENYEEAATLLKEGQKKFKDATPVYLLYARYLLQKKDFKKLADILKITRGLESEHSLAYHAKYLEYMGMLQAALGKNELAAKFLKLALDIKESDELRSKLAALELGGAKNVNALISDSKRIDFMNRSKQAEKEQNWEKAIFNAIQAVDIAPNSIEARILLSRIQIQQGYFGKAIDTLNELQKQYPYSKSISVALIQAYTESYKFSDVNNLLQKLSSSPFRETWEYYSLLGHMYVKSGNNLLAIGWLQKSIVRNPLADEDHYLLAQTYFNYRKYDKVKSLISKAIELDPVNIEYKCFYARILYELDNAETAIGYLRDILNDYPDNPRILSEIAIYYHRSGQIKYYNDTRKKIESMNLKDKNLYEFLLSIATIDNNDAEVIKNYEELLKLAPGDLKTKMDYAQYLMKNSRYEKAEVLLKDIQERCDSYPKLLYHLSKLYLSKGLIEKSLQLAKQEVADNPHLPHGYILLGEIYVKKADYNEATNNYARGMALDNKSTEAIKGLAWIKLYQNHIENALDLYTQALKLDPNDPIIRRQLGYVYKALGQSSLALEAFRVYLELDPDAKDKNEIKRNMEQLK